MTLPELVLRNARVALDSFCGTWISPSPEEGFTLSYTLEGETITLLVHSDSSVESRNWARLCFNDDLNQWTLHHPDDAGHWVLCLNAPPTLNIGRLLSFLQDDPFGHFRP